MFDELIRSAFFFIIFILLLITSNDNSSSFRRWRFDLAFNCYRPVDSIVNKIVFHLSLFAHIVYSTSVVYM